MFSRVLKPRGFLPEPPLHSRTMGLDADEPTSNRESLYNSDLLHVFEWENTNPHTILRDIRHRIATRGENEDVIEYELTSDDEHPLDVQSNVEKTGVVDGELTYTGDRTLFYKETVTPDDGQPELLRLIGSAFAGLLTALLTFVGAAFGVVAVAELYFGMTGYYNALTAITKLGAGLSISEGGLAGAVVAVLGVGLTYLVYQLVRYYYDEWQYVTSKRKREWFVEPIATIKFDGEVGHNSAYEGEMQSNKSVLSGDFEVIVGENIDIEIEERGEVVDPRDLD